MKPSQRIAELERLERENLLLKDKIRATSLAAITGLIFLAIVGLIIIVTQHSQIKQLPPQNLGAVYYDAHGSAWVRFDLKDTRQVFLVKQLEALCKANTIPNCMNALDRLGVR